MAYENKDNTGSMFPNDRKESANHPDAKGSAMIDGVEYWVSGWNKKTQDGKNWRSLAFTRKDARAEPPPKMAPKSQDAFKARQLADNRTADRSQPHHGGSGFDDIDQDIPF